MSHLHLESCLQLLLLTARVVFKGPTMYGTCKARVACFAGNVFFFGRPVFWFRKSSCFFSQKRVSRDAMFTNCFADWSLSEPLWNGVEGPRHEVKNVIVKRNCAFEFFRQKCILHVFFFVCCHVCRVCVGSLLQSSFFRAHKSHFPKSETKIARKSYE